MFHLFLCSYNKTRAQGSVAQPLKKSILVVPLTVADPIR